jgi:GT2 family glycosyltransferase
MMKNTVYIVVLNWNGWQDTMACLESLAGLRGASVRIVVCDNGSRDDSLRYLRDWAEGVLWAPRPDHPRLAALYSRAPGTPTAYQCVRREEVLAGTAPAATEPLILLDNGENLGFAGGNNVGIRYAMAQPDMSHLWLLNNDTLVDPDALRCMLDRLESVSQPAVCGCRLMFADDPTVIQAIGGNSFNRWTGNASASLGRFLPEGTAIDSQAYEARVDYICGASMLLPRAFLEQVGLMSEDYFLYYEEVDWMTRAADRYRQLIAADAVVYHKEGSAIGSASLRRRASLFSEFYMMRNKLRFTRRHHPLCLPSCWLTTWGQALNRLLRGEFASALQLGAILLGVGRCPPS